MSKRRVPRFVALIGTFAAAASLIGIAIGATGAYYTDSHSGDIHGTNGTVAISVTGSGPTSVNDPSLVQFDFSGILPGTPKTATVNVTNPTGNPEDIWLVFGNSNGMWSAVNDLGQYGKFGVGGYVYDNLNNSTANTNTATPGVAGTPSTTSFMSGSCSTVGRVPINYLPHAIKITTLAGGGSASFPISFEYNACMTDHQGDPLFNPASADAPIPLHVTPGPLMFHIVAFQGGVDPTSPFNGANAITPLTLLGVFDPFTQQYIQY